MISQWEGIHEQTWHYDRVLYPTPLRIPTLMPLNPRCSYCYGICCCRQADFGKASRYRPYLLICASVVFGRARGRGLQVLSAVWLASLVCVCEGFRVVRVCVSFRSASLGVMAPLNPGRYTYLFSTLAELRLTFQVMKGL